MLRIAIMSDESLPLGTRVHAKMIHELALEFQQNNHTSVVITPGSPNQSAALVIDFVDGVEYWRFKSGYTRGVGMVRRLINEFLLSFRAWHAIDSQVEKTPFELCICYCPTIFFAPLSSKLKATSNRNAWKTTGLLTRIPSSMTGLPQMSLTSLPK